MALDRTHKFDRSRLPENSYLSDPARGLRLIASLLAGKGMIEEKKVFDCVDELTGACGRLEQAGLADGFSRLRQILSFLELPARSRLLANAAIVGLGGQFSSGKSSILNSLLGEDPQFRLPEDLKASTSIATYVMQAPDPKVMACTKKGEEIELDPQALQAISHRFQSAHKINPAQYIEFIGISLPEFPVRGVALMDTPGYNPSDVATQQEYRDGSRSRNALNSADHLVWLISAKEPLLSSSDQHFIQSLNLSGEITVIVNKCDLISEVYSSPDPEHSEPIENIRRNFEEAGIRFSSIIPYSASKPEWNDGKKKITDFLQKVADEHNSVEERIDKIKTILSEIEIKFQNEIETRNRKLMKEIDNCIDICDNPLDLTSLSMLRGMIWSEHFNIEKDYEEFKSASSIVHNWIKERYMA